jgi:TctA family transporter
LVEENFMTSMMKSDGNLLGFFERPIAAVLGIITLGIWAWVILGWIRGVAGSRRTPLDAEPAD